MKYLLWARMWTMHIVPFTELSKQPQVLERKYEPEKVNDLPRPLAFESSFDFKTHVLFRALGCISFRYRTILLEL